MVYFVVYDLSLLLELSHDLAISSFKDLILRFHFPMAQKCWMLENTGANLALKVRNGTFISRDISLGKESSHCCLSRTILLIWFSNAGESSVEVDSSTEVEIVWGFRSN